MATEEHFMEQVSGVIIFGVDNSSSSHADNLKHEGDTFGINGSFGAPEKCFMLILVKQTHNLA